MLLNPCKRALIGLALALSVLASLPALSHEGPDPAARWQLAPAQLQGQTLRAIIGPDAAVEGAARFDPLGNDSAMRFDGNRDALVVGEDLDDAADALPTEAFTIVAVVGIDQPQRWGGIIGAIQDNGGEEQGWVLGFDNEHFTFGLSTAGADDGDGHMTYLTGRTAYESGRLYHVVATYDGRTLALYVDGQLEAVTTDQSGAVLYPESGQLAIGTYRDSNEDNFLRGRIAEVTIFHDAANADWVEGHVEHHRALLGQRVEPVQPTGDPERPHEMMVRPFLQAAAQDGMTVTWETNQPAVSAIHWGPTQRCARSTELEGRGTVSDDGFVHQGRITGLLANTQYFYRVESIDEAGRPVRSEVSTFQTAPDANTPFAFAAISDTQGNAEVAGRISELAWSHRPNFLLHPGDLVSTGSNKDHWTQTFFPSMHPLISRAPIYPVLGNHEQDAAFYYHYMDLPEPEYYYTFTYGNAQFFMIDTNRNVGPESEQYQWLDGALEASEATWKIVCHHHPPYSSDENDYGNLWNTNTSTRGDTRARQLTTLYDEHSVDIVWNGHIHSYERTWPLTEGEPVDTGGTLYMITGGGGGGLETPGPFRNPFTNVVQRGHHFTMVHVNGRTLEARVYTDQGELFDTFTLDKRQ